MRFVRHRPEETLLYRLAERHYPDFLAALEERERYLPVYVQEEFEAYLKCGRLEHGFLRVRCTTCHAERLVAFSCKRVFTLDLTSRENCSDQVRVIACLEDPAVIGRILAHLDRPARVTVCGVRNGTLA